jgi:cytochrome oxidase Cu insertion factor (SCO1/SenC/PrrC family)/thiol-disulfide isomerase/thioredoxin
MRRRTITLWQVVGLAALAVAAVSIIGILAHSPSSPSASQLVDNPDLDGGTTLSGQAPGFTLTDQFGRRVSLSSLRGKVVILAFNDPECTTICPLTTTEMVDAKAMLGAAGSQVQLLGVDANPSATSIGDVRAYSQAHGMTHAWEFLTGPVGALKRIWRAYHIEVQIEQGAVDHTPALYMISSQGKLAKVYLTEMAYAGIRQQSQILARGAASLLHGDPSVHSNLSYARIPAIDPSATATVPAAGGGSLHVGPSGSPRLLLYFDTWDSEVTDLASELGKLDRYAARATADHLPGLTVIDEGSVEPSPQALPRFLAGLPSPLTYPVGIDESGRLGDGYGVEDEPWFVLVSASGQILWRYDVSTSGWPSMAALSNAVHAALARGPRAPGSESAAQRQLAGSPAALEALHKQSNEILGSQAQLTERLRALRGYPIVLNAWASWCTPCRTEFPLLAAASAHFGRQVAFLGADAEDAASSAKAFLAEHPVSYPSYETTTEALIALAPIEGLPTTIFINPAGKVVHVHIGQYDAQGTLDEDIRAYALGS